jgi:V/A-type H+-transporting ATPase subunit B
MGFKMNEWDLKLLKYGAIFEQEMMDLSVNTPLEQALDNGWRILASCFSPEETRLRSELVGKFWPARQGGGAG